MPRLNYQKPIIEIPLPDLISVQKESYRWLFDEGIKELFDEINPVEDFTGRNFVLEFGHYGQETPKIDEDTAKRKNLSYKAPLKVKVTLTNKITGKKQSGEVFLGDFPVMTPRGTFIVNGIERVVVTQIVRSFGSLFIAEEAPDGRKLFGAKIIPTRGAWLEMETSSRNVISVKIDRKRRIPITSFLKAMAGYTNDEIMKRFADVDVNPDRQYIKTTLERDPAETDDEAVIEVYKRIRPGDLATPESARTFLETMFYNHKRYSLGKVGRYKMNQRLGLNVANTTQNRLLRIDDVVAVIREIIRLNNDPLGAPDDIDHLKNRRVRAVGELVQTRLRVGLLRMERIVKDRMSVSDPQMITPGQLINNRPVIAVLQEFFASSQLSQFMDQTNPLAELEHKRRIAATGPGGLSRERAGFEVRDVHNSHYGRICPITTPEGPNIGLVGQLATYAKINEYGFIETPYLKVTKVNGKPKITNQIVYLDAATEEKHVIAPASTNVDKANFITGSKAIVRVHGEPKIESINLIEYIDVSPRQIVSVSTALIPFVENDDAVRASMGSNMLRQAVPLIRPDSPVVGTGMEKDAARDSGQLIFAEESGTVIEADSSHIIVLGKTKKVYNLSKFVRSNQGTCINQRPVVRLADKVSAGQILADSSGTDQGELALGQNVLVAFMSFGGANFEDAIIISDRLVREDRYTSIHIEKHVIEVRETKLGPELITRDIPNVSEEALADLDDSGIVRIGAWVEAGDILVGKISPKGETELSAEEKLLRAIFGEKAKEVMDTSLRLPHGEYGKIVDVKIFSKQAGDELPAGVTQTVEVAVAQLRKVSVGDKLAGRHGNKGVIAKILPIEDMPRLPNGTPVDIILNPLGVVSRMNLGQIMETHLGWAGLKAGVKFASPVFQGIDLPSIQEHLKQNNLPQDGKIQLFDGRTGEPFDEKTTVGIIYIMKLIHLVDDKIHARSTGPYSMVTQQPLGGKAQFGGQRFGEMEVWALEAYGAAHILQEMLTIKSDDVFGRSKAYESIIKGEPIQKPSTPASFMVLMRELQSLGLNVEMLKRGHIISDQTIPIQTVKPVSKSRDLDEEITEIMTTQEKPSEVPKSEEIDAKKNPQAR
ncbi:DNA-directed RNA polymerase subunit beta [Candidatus Berkelbacteria bacterium]|nr:DNA-directed RNA polymerase subunit beta [Candidatus Berkelbacteria bacterium]